METKSRMNENRCPQCNLLNLPAAAECLKCRTPLLARLSTTFSEQKTADFPNVKEDFRETKTAEYVNASADFPPPASFHSQILPQSKTGSRTYFWYRMLCSITVVSGAVWAIIGLIAVIGSFNQTGKEAADAFTGGVFMLFSGGIPALLFLLGVIFPPRPWSWIFGILLLVLALLSCVFAPFAVALLIFWMKRETQIYFGRG
jgi:hypothetical protein